MSLPPPGEQCDHGLHDDRQHVPLSPRSAHDDQGPSRRTHGYHGPEDDRRHGSLSTSSAGGDQGQHIATLSPRRAEVHHRPNDDW